MKKKDKIKEISSWSEIKDRVYGKKGTERRENLERESDSFKIGLFRKQENQKI